MRVPGWEARWRLHDALAAMGYAPSFEPRSGDLLFERDAAGPTRISFDPKGHPTTIEEPGGRRSRLASDDAGRPTALTLPRGGTYRFAQDEQGRVTSVTNPDGTSQEVVYRHGRPVEIRRSQRAAIGVEMDGSGQVTALRDGRGASLRFDYDASGLPSRIVDRAGGVTSYARDEDGRLLELRTPRGAVWRFETNEMGVRTIVRPDGSREQQLFSDTRRPLVTVLADGATTTAAFAEDGQPTSLDYADGTKVRLEWAEPGRPALADNGVHVARFEYDSAGRRTRDEVDGKAVAVTYDSGGTPTSLAMPSGESVTYTPGPDGRIDEMRDWSGNVYRISWSPSGDFAGIECPGGIRTNVVAGPAGRVASLEYVTRKARRVRTYSYDANDLVAKIEEGSGTQLAYEYDADDRLVGVSAPSETVRYAWDADGNMTAGNGHTFGYDALDRLSSRDGVPCKSDAAGNVLGWAARGGQLEFAYNAQNQLSSVKLPDGSRAEYEYDAFGRRIVKRLRGQTTRFTWFGDQLVSEETEGASRSRTDYLYLPGTPRPIAMRRDGVVYFYEVDHLDTPIRMVDAGGNVVWQGTPFGTEFRVTAAKVAQPLRFPGQYFDDETGLHYNVARYYDPASGRYIGSDPPFQYGDANPYRYARGNPVAFVDPSGRNPILAAIGIAAATGAAIGGVFGAAHQIASNIANKDKGWDETFDGVAGAAVRGAIAGAVGGVSALGGAVVGFFIAGPPGAVVGGVLMGFVGAGAAGAGIAAFDAPEGKGWEACEEALIGSIPFYGAARRYSQNPNDPNRGRQLAVDLAFDAVTVALTVVGAKRAYSGAKAAEAAGATGMGKLDGIRQQEYAKQERVLIIDRASNEASRQYDGKPGYAPKPHEVETLKTSKEGKTAGLVVEPENPTPAQEAEIARLKSKGWSFDEDGVLVDPQGNRIHGDYDLQGVYKVSVDENGKKTYTPVDTNDPAFQQDYNDRVTPGRQMVQHGANDNYKVIDENGNEVMGRQPSPNERFKITDENGNPRVFESTAEYQQYCEENGIPWQYQNYR